ncbi:IS3 family transposase [Mycoplasmatota bacterium zrk1]
MDSLKDKYRIIKLCGYLEVSKSGYYAWIRRGKPKHIRYNELTAGIVLDIFNQTKHGYRMINDLIKLKYGLIIDDKTVYRYMKLLGIQSPVRRKRFKSCTINDPNEKSRDVKPNALDRNFKANKPLQKLVTDVSYVYHKGGRLYLSVLKDLYDNSIVAYQMSKFNDMKLVMDMMNDFIDNYYEKLPFPCVVHSDQGFQYTHKSYINLLNNNLIMVSHSRKGNCLDNSPCENWFSHLKSESLELRKPVNELDLYYRIEEYILYYNNDRPQRKLKSMTPIEFRNHA